MNLRNYINPFLIIVSAAFFLGGCFSTGSFSKEELRFGQPFTKPQQLIFQSPSGQRDTIAFSSVLNDTFRVRHFERGFYNEIWMNISYKLSLGSYHRFTVKSINNEPEYFLSFGQAKGSHSSKEISFLGLVFNEEYINSIIGQKEEVIIFRNENAQYSGMNVNEGINSFKFSFAKGVVSFIDNKNIEWQIVN